MWVSATRSITVGVSNLERALHLFSTTMRLQVDWQAPLDTSVLEAWGLDPSVDAKAAELSCKGYPYGRLQIVEFSPTPERLVRDDFGEGAQDSPLDIGPKAIDFYVDAPIDNALKIVIDDGYIARSDPHKHQIGNTISEEVVVSGPDKLPMLLMVGHRHAETSLRNGSPDGPFSEIATASVICGDLETTREFYGETLGLAAVNDAETPEQYRDLVDNLVDAPPGTRIHFLLYAAEGEASGKILLIHFFDVDAKRLAGRMHPGNLGFSLFSHEVDDIGLLHRNLVSIGSEIVQEPIEVKTPSGRRSIMLVRGPNEEMFEFFSARSQRR